MEVNIQLCALTTLLPRKEASGTFFMGGWMDPRDSLNIVANRKIPTPTRE